MWESPIYIIYKDLTEQLEGEVFKAIQEVGINVDRDELLKALNYDRWQYEKGYADGKMDAQLELAQPKDQRIISVEGNAKWEYKDTWSVFECSCCGRSMVRNVYNYCPWCGARMG